MSLKRSIIFRPNTEEIPGSCVFVLAWILLEKRCTLAAAMAESFFKVSKSGPLAGTRGSGRRAISSASASFQDRGVTTCPCNGIDVFLSLCLADISHYLRELVPHFNDKRLKQNFHAQGGHVEPPPVVMKCLICVRFRPNQNVSHKRTDSQDQTRSDPILGHVVFEKKVDSFRRRSFSALIPNVPYVV